MSPYPRDEFDKVPETSSRQGVHRERLIPAQSRGLGLIITVGVLALVLGLAAYFVLPRLGIGADDAAGPAGDPAAAAQASAPASEPEPSEESDTSAAASPSESPASEEASDGVDRSQPVVVLNGTGIPGVGSIVSGRIAAGGWTAQEIAVWSGQQLPGSVIFYNGADQLAAAQELSLLLEIPTVAESAEFDLVTVVAGPGFQEE
ncbi:LytR C-terminal domain-containing protein [Arthrobacter sp. NPDC097144]|uniref:LytR C-terminal domain-containing protein n=1 Tax=Arthrobacter sp. NPDC097144 TaxID=3363946 RepID=UPI003804AE7D